MNDGPQDNALQPRGKQKGQQRRAGQDRQNDLKAQALHSALQIRFKANSADLLSLTTHS
jgi:hypothetical protein